jgi:competence protein ComFB
MEDLVLETVDELFAELPEEEYPLIHCHQCRLDVACYVLNRTQPEYIISGRGLVHFENDYQQRVQKKADLVALVKEGVRKIHNNRRPYYEQSGPPSQEIKKGPVFNFPAIVGRILHGKTFEPMSDIHVALLRDGEPVPMIDSTWQNPYYVVESTQGNFTFLPHPEKADYVGERRRFPFEINVTARGYSPLQHFFQLELTASDEVLYNFRLQNTLKTDALYLFPENEPLERNE